MVLLPAKHRVPPKCIPCPWPSRHGKGYVIVSAAFLLLSGSLRVIAEASTERIKNGGGLHIENDGPNNIPDIDIGIGSERESKENDFGGLVQEAAYSRDQMDNPGSEPHGVRLTATESAFGGRRILSKYLDIYEPPFKDPAGSSDYDDGPHFFGISKVSVYGKNTVNCIQLTYREDGEGGSHGECGNEKYEEHIVFGDDEDIISVEVQTKNEKKKEKKGRVISVILTTTAGRRVAFGHDEDSRLLTKVEPLLSDGPKSEAQDNGYEAKPQPEDYGDGGDYDEGVEAILTDDFGDFSIAPHYKCSSDNHCFTATFNAMQGHILGGIHGDLEDSRKKNHLESLGVHWVVKSPTRRIEAGNILFGQGSLYLPLNTIETTKENVPSVPTSSGALEWMNTDEVITEKVPSVTTIDGALKWLEEDQQKKNYPDGPDFGPRNPVVLWQISPDENENYLVVHRRRFLEQQWNQESLSACEFATSTTDMAKQQSQFFAWMPPTTVFCVVQEVCVGNGLEQDSCGKESDCCSGLCHEAQCVPCLPAGGQCKVNSECCDFLSCSDGLCIEVPSSSPSSMPSSYPSEVPSLLPSFLPSLHPSDQPSVEPSDVPSLLPTTSPSSRPSNSPSEVPSDVPTSAPSDFPTLQHSETPSSLPSFRPTVKPRYDAEKCDFDSQCISQRCIDNLCGWFLKINANSILADSVSEIELPHSVSYGVFQDEEGQDGGILIADTGIEAKMKGNVWRAFPFEYAVTKNTVLEFEFKVEDEAEGHAICLDENLQEFDDLPSSHRCFKLAGTQDWDDTFVYIIDQAVKDTNVHHYKIKIGDQSGPHIPPGIKINYLALVQDNDENHEGGESSFKNIQVYEDMVLEENSFTQRICDKRKSIMDAYAKAIDNGIFTEGVSSVLRSDSNYCPYLDETIPYLKQFELITKIFPYDGGYPHIDQRYVDINYLPMRSCNYFDEDISIYDLDDTPSPTIIPVSLGSQTPSVSPSLSPSQKLTISNAPTQSSTTSVMPSGGPSSTQSFKPSLSSQPSVLPTISPSSGTPTSSPTQTPTGTPTTNFMFELFQGEDGKIRHINKGHKSEGTNLCLGTPIHSDIAAELFDINIPDTNYIAFLFPCDGTNPVAHAFQEIENEIRARSVSNRAPPDVAYSFNNMILKNFSRIKAEELPLIHLWGHQVPRWQPGQCDSCGYERNLDDNKCIKVDECFYRSNACPRYSACSETKEYCQCNPGYRNSDDGTERVDSSSTDTCVLQLLADQRVTGESFKMSISMPNPLPEFFTLGCTRMDEANTDQPPMTTIHHGKIVEASKMCKDDICSYDFDQLRSGRLYHASIVSGEHTEASLSRRLGEDVNKKYTTDAVTRCCCNCPTDPMDNSGRPINFNTTQHNGDVLFNFTDNSRCAEAYAFSRSEVFEEFSEDKSSKAVFAPNYYFFPKSKCSSSLILPGQGAKDDLRISELKVGTGYNYCVRAVGEHYSDHTSDVSGETVFSSDETCTIHVVRWQASLSGKITTEPESGSLPIERVTVTWTLYSNSNRENVIAQGSQVTDESGLFMAHFDELSLHLANEKEYPVLVQFSKLTEVVNGIIIHKFLCNEGTVNCTETGTIVYLKHLEFEKPLHVYDATSVPFKGRVLIEGTGSEASGDGCLINGATVCLVDKSISGSGRICVDTNFKGEYEAPAIIGSTVSVEVNYRNHTFLPFYDNNNDYDKGITIHPDGQYERNDFMDMTKAHLFVEVAGGLCNHTLGISTIQVKVSQCHWFQNFPQDSFKAAYLVPGSMLDVSVIKVVSADDADVKLTHIMEVFGTDEMTKKVNLLDTSEEDEDIKKAEDAENNSDIANELDQLQRAMEVVRFQYTGTLTLDFHLAGATSKGNCTFADLGGVPGQGSSSLHVIPLQKVFNVEVLLKYELNKDLFCDIVSDNMKVRVFNKVGVDGYPSFTEFFESIKDKVSRDTLQLCSDESGCDFAVEHDEIDGKTSGGAKMIPRDATGKEIEFLTGRPNIDEPFTKLFKVEAIDRGISYIHEAHVIVTGDFEEGKGPSFALPTYKPILVLRDPPGGLSTASYQNVQSSIKVTSNSLESYAGFDAGLKLGAGVDQKADFCTGAAVGAVAISCTGLLEVKVSAKVSNDLKMGHYITRNQDTYTGKFTTTWSYTTSDNPFEAGRRSDVMVVPNLNVNYIKVASISFNSDSEFCKPTRTDGTKFDLTSQQNKPTLSFLTMRNIEDFQIPELNDTILLLKDKETNETNFDETQIQIKALSDSLDAWVNAVKSYDDTNELAMNGEIANLALAQTWFTKWVGTKDKDENEPLPENHWSSLLPERLKDNAVALDHAFMAKSSSGLGSGQDLKDTNRIHFSGGGSIMGFSMNHEKIQEIQRMDPTFLANGNVERTGGVEADGSYNTLGLDVTTDVQGAATFSVTSSSTFTNSKDSSTSISFVLGDPDREDEFITDILIDPHFGTFMFPLISGRSKNPHEVNTEWGEIPIVNVKERPTMPVMPADEMLFKVVIENLGVSASSFNVFIDQTTNEGSLSHSISGRGSNVNYWLEPGAKIEQDLTITRGPSKYLYKANVLRIAAKWDGYGNEGKSTVLWNYQDDDGDLWIKFEEPCPRVEWAGSIKRNDGFLVNKEASEIEMSIFNPSYQRGSFEKLAVETRLNSVDIMYRELGEIGWENAYALDDSNDPIYFNLTAPNGWTEDSYGYSNIVWNVAETLDNDGTYELKVKTVCSHVAGAPDDFNIYSSTPIIGVVDRVKPKLYGSPLPLSAVIMPGEEIAVMFTEPIMCEMPYRFDLIVTVSGIEKFFDERNLNVFCQGRKLAFKFDQTNVRYEDLLGKEVNVSVAKVSDLHRNYQTGEPIKFSKTVANLNLDEVSTSFMFTLESMTSCLAEEAIQNEIAGILALNDPSRINVVRSECLGGTTIEAEVTIGPVTSTGLRRVLSGKDTQNAIDLFYSLVDMTNDDGSVRRNMGSTKVTHFSVSDMKLIPGSTDEKLHKPTADLALKEEMIRKGNADESTLLQASHIVKLGESLEHMAQKMDQLSSEQDGTTHSSSFQVKEIEHMLTELGQERDEMHSELESLENMVQKIDQLSSEQDGTIHSSDFQIKEIEHMLTELGQERDEMHFELVCGVAIAAGLLLVIAVTGIVIAFKH